MKALRFHSVNVPWFVVLHTMALVALIALAAGLFSWLGFAVAILLYVVTGGMGVCVGNHRLLTHNSFETYRPVKWVLAVLGTLSGEGENIHWVAVHRKHHRHSDALGDPHSPHHHSGFRWAHMGWMLQAENWAARKELDQKYAPDLLADPVLVWIRKIHIVWHLGLAASLFCLGLFWGWQAGLSCVLWGMGVRMVVVLHATWFVNSAAHLWGYRNYKTKDNSRNNWVVALITFGEGWHNNHHRYPTAANHGQRRFEFDSSWWIIRTMVFLRLAWNAKYQPYRPQK